MYAHNRINRFYNGKKPVEEYWKMRGFNHDLRKERITMERVLGMMVRRFGILWPTIEHTLLCMRISTVPSVFYKHP
jgi:hypothetical protein